jgi:hypothetical protein
MKKFLVLLMVVMCSSASANINDIQTITSVEHSQMGPGKKNRRKKKSNKKRKKHCKKSSKRGFAG